MCIKTKKNRIYIHFDNHRFESIPDFRGTIVYLSTTITSIFTTYCLLYLSIILHPYYIIPFSTLVIPLLLLLFYLLLFYLVKDIRMSDTVIDITNLIRSITSHICLDSDLIHTVFLCFYGDLVRAFFKHVLIRIA